jgi:hypothetical protein
MFQPNSNNPSPITHFIVASVDEIRSDARRSEFAPSSQANQPNDADSTTWVCERLTECYNE